MVKSRCILKVQPTGFPDRINELSGEEFKNDSRVFCLQKCWKFSALYGDFIHLLDNQRCLVSSWIYEHAVWERRLT